MAIDRSVTTQLPATEPIPMMLTIAAPRYLRSPRAEDVGAVAELGAALLAAGIPREELLARLRGYDVEIVTEERRS
jgi:hypothetical protein